MVDPRRKITGAYFHTGHYGCRKGGGSYELLLECGHREWRKASRVPKDTARCRQCGRDREADREAGREVPSREEEA